MKIMCKIKTSKRTLWKRRKVLLDDRWVSLDPLVAGHVKTSGCDPPDADKTKPLKVLLHESDLPSAIHDDITEPR